MATRVKKGRIEKIESSKRNIFATPKSDISTVLKGLLPYPGEKKSKKLKNRQKQDPCSVITSDKWLDIEEDKEKSKMQKEQEKLERKQARELKKQKVEEKPTKKKNNKKIQHIEAQMEETSSEEEWQASGSSDDDVDFLEETVPDIELMKPENLNPGSFILVEFNGMGKRMTMIFKYVATILKVVSEDEYEIKCLKSLDKQKTTFDYLEMDVSIISKENIIGQLPHPVLHQDGRRLVTKFPGSISEVYEKQ